MLKDIVWAGIDFGETILDPRGMSPSQILRNIYTELGKPETIEEKIRKHKELEEKYGGIKGLVESRQGINEVYSYVLDNDSRAIKLFREEEVKSFKPSNGAEQALCYLRSKGIDNNLVAESGSEYTLRNCLRFLESHNLRSEISEIFTPMGKVKQDGTIDPSYEGLTKRSGKLYDRLKEELNRKNVSTSQAVIIGDDPVADIEKPREREFHTVQYKGVRDRGPSVADYTIANWSELPSVL
jgi:hypothetical protein